MKRLSDDAITAAAFLFLTVFAPVAVTSRVLSATPPLDNKTLVHLVFSTGCSQTHRQFLSASLQLSLVRVGHVGPLTEIISGCSPLETAEIEGQPTFYPDFRLHFTKDFQAYASDDGFTDHYKAYNKPYGLRHFLQHAAVPDDLAVAFIDADYMLFKPLRVNTGAAWGKYYQKTTVRNASDITDTVQDGFALAQNMKAFLGERWFNNYNRTILNLVCEGQRCANVSTAEAF
ncbi:hypothetical protein As57867_004769, partial [Aphanomyces stellatus]